MNSQWFDVDVKGLANLLARKGKEWALFELIQNAFDAKPEHVWVTVDPMPGCPFAEVTVEDDSSEGWPQMAHAFTMFAKSRRASDPSRRGRFNLGEKLVLSCCREASIETMTGTIKFTSKGRRMEGKARELGTKFTGVMKMTRAEMEDAIMAAHQIIPPAGVEFEFNGTVIERPEPLAVFECKLPTEFMNDEGEMRRTVRTTHVEAFAEFEGEGGIMEMGIPVCTADWPWRLNVQQKVPLSMERDSVTYGFRRALQVEAMNRLADTLTPEMAAEPWATEAMGDSRATSDTVKKLVTKRFGERAVVHVPGDPIANAQAEAAGCTVVHGGALDKLAWMNVRKAGVMPSASQAFPTPKPVEQPEQQTCPACGQPVRG